MGAAVLARGGNAADAAIATVFALSVTHSSAASLGGGGFALVRRRQQPTEAIDFRETAPRSLTRAGFDKMIAAGARGRAAVGVPGTVAGLALLHARHGSLPMTDLVAPAAALARDGHPLGSWQARLVAASYRALETDPAANAIFGRRGQPRGPGSRIVQADLASVLERLAATSLDDFYEGEVAKKLARALAPGGPSADDLAAYRAVVRTPLFVDYRGYTIETMPPPSAGGVALTGMLLLHASTAPLEYASADQVHWLIESARRAQSERRVGVRDPDAWGPELAAAKTARFLEPSFWLTRPIDPRRATPSERLRASTEPGSVESEHTTHVSVIDADGFAVSLTTTLSASFGAKIVAPGTGIVMNNAVASFGIGGENQPVAGQRTVSSMAPTLVLRGAELAAVLGTPGGDTIPSTLAQLVLHLVDHRLPLDQAIDAPRWHHGFVPDIARHERSPAPPRALLDELKARGHRVQPFRKAVGDANCIVVDPGGLRAHGYADPREYGAASIPSALAPSTPAPSAPVPSPPASSAPAPSAAER